MKKNHRFIGFTFLILLLLTTAVFVPAKAQNEANYIITVDPIGHWHVFGSKTLTFSVYDAATSDGVEGLELVIEIARAGSESVSVRSVSEEQIQDQGDGLYSLEYTPSTLDAYALSLHFEKDGQVYYSSPIAFETSRAGEEGIRAEGNDTEYVYQIRYNWDPGHIHANDEEPVTLVFELIRGIQTGDDINWEQPWTNNFDHVTEVQDAVLILSTDDDSVSEEIALVYQGRGIYEAERIFTVEEVGDGLDVNIQCSFTDAFNGAEVTLSEPAVLHAVPSH